MLLVPQARPLIRHRRSLRSSHLSPQVCHDSHRVTLEKLLFQSLLCQQQVYRDKLEVTLSTQTLVSSSQIPLHLLHLYHQVVEFSHVVLPLGWTSSKIPRIWTSVMSVVTATLRQHGIHKLLCVDDLLITCSSFEEESRVRQIIEDTLLATCKVRSSLKSFFDTPTQTLPDHLVFIISTLGKGTFRVPERR